MDKGRNQFTFTSNQIVRFYNTYKSLAGFSVVTYQTPANYTLANYAKAPYNASVQILTPGKMITTDSGINAYQIMYYDNGSGYNVKDMDTVVINTKYGMLHILTYRTEPPGFDANLGKAKQMVDSFQFTN